MEYQGTRHPLTMDCSQHLLYRTKAAKTRSKVILHPIQLTPQREARDSRHHSLMVQAGTVRNQQPKLETKRHLQQSLQLTSSPQTLRPMLLPKHSCSSPLKLRHLTKRKRSVLGQRMSRFKFHQPNQGLNSISKKENCKTQCISNSLATLAFVLGSRRTK